MITFPINRRGALLFFLVPSILLLLLIPACKQGSSGNSASLNTAYLMDTWQIVSISLPEMSEKDFPNRENFDAYLQTKITMQNLTADNLQMEMQFMEDGQMLTTTMGENVKSTYYIDDQSLFMIVEGNPPEKYDVLEITPNSMVLRLLDKTINNSFIDMHLERR